MRVDDESRSARPLLLAARVSPCLPRPQDASAQTMLATLVLATFRQSRMGQGPTVLATAQICLCVDVGVVRTYCYIAIGPSAGLPCKTSAHSRRRAPFESEFLLLEWNDPKIREFFGKIQRSASSFAWIRSFITRGVSACEVWPLVVSRPSGLAGGNHRVHATRASPSTDCWPCRERGQNQVCRGAHVTL